MSLAVALRKRPKQKQFCRRLRVDTTEEMYRRLVEAAARTEHTTAYLMREAIDKHLRYLECLL